MFEIMNRSRRIATAETFQEAKAEARKHPGAFVVFRKKANPALCLSHLSEACKKPCFGYLADQLL